MLATVRLLQPHPAQTRNYLTVFGLYLQFLLSLIIVHTRLFFAIIYTDLYFIFFLFTASLLFLFLFLFLPLLIDKYTIFKISPKVVSITKYTVFSSNSRTEPSSFIISYFTS